MRFMQASSDGKKENLARKLRALMVRDSLTQKQIADAAHVDQPFVSRVLNCEYERISARVVRIYDYVDMRENGSAVPHEAAMAVASYVAAGGRIDLLCEAINLLTEVQISRRG